MPRSCYVEGCPGDYGWGSKAWKKPTPLSFFRVPSIISEKNRKFRGQEDRLKKVIELSKVRRKAWLKILKREHTPDCQIIQICARHFISGQPAHLEDKENPDWVPTVGVGSESSPVESPEEEEEISNDDSSQREIDEYMPNEESAPEDATAPFANDSNQQETDEYIPNDESTLEEATAAFANDSSHQETDEYMPNEESTLEDATAAFANDSSQNEINEYIPNDESTLEEPTTVFANDPSQKEIDEYMPNDESSQEDAAVLYANGSTEQSNESSNPKQARYSTTENSTEDTVNRSFEDSEIYSELEPVDEGQGHFHIQFCTKKACLLSKSNAMYALKPASNGS